jgi:uncharacterized membrane protein
MSALSQPSPGERLWHFLALLALGSLIAVYGLQHLLFPSRLSTTGQGVVFALQSLPLLVCLPTLLKGSARGAAYVAFLAMPYFVVAILTLLDPVRRGWGAAELFFSLQLFLGTTYFAKARGMRNTALLAESAEGQGASAGATPSE